ncbi:hypothetical protein GPX89_18725 [Nocardia sp. ET3-3]|uniref:Uncharacterized protein n=1 Tax=Nocardia terrae TaxID=2675851 RepID=A0A7K1UY18_9NOCA|nr:hypothetical protein [Nocardia terrae]MVU79266.1 hypothetical protein [Nocardia terrae]
MIPRARAGSRQITSDFSFTPSARDLDYRETEHRVDYVQFLGIPAGFAIYIAAFVLLIVMRLLHKRRTRAAI